MEEDLSENCKELIKKHMKKLIDGKLDRKGKVQAIKPTAILDKTFVNKFEIFKRFFRLIAASIEHFSLFCALSNCNHVH